VVSTVPSADIDRVVAVITRAFSADPVCCWIWPDRQTYFKAFPAFVHAFGGRAFANKTADQVNGYAGAALWLSPGVEPDADAIAASLPAERASELDALFEKMASYHPHESHWYLPLVGVDPAEQRKGHGTALLEDRLHHVDEHHVAAYLESTNVSNIELYRRLGFTLLGTIEVGAMPPLYPMLRPAR
jgi:ribosomal protein S18 acetylase RimI-like enzyme